MFLLTQPENAAAAELERQLAAAEHRGEAFLAWAEAAQRERERMDRYRRTAERLLRAGAGRR